MPRSGSRVRVPSRALAMKIAYAAVAQSVERRIGSAEVTGPIPVSSSSKDGCVAVTIENSLLQPFLFYACFSICNYWNYRRILMHEPRSKNAEAFLNI